MHNHVLRIFPPFTVYIYINYHAITNMLIDYFTVKILGIFIVSSFFVADAYAYIDPGTGSIVIQAIAGALIGVGITLKIYWYKFKGIFNFKKS